MYENLLPIGSVVLLKGGDKRVMIICRISAPTNEGKVYDYGGCLYPEGVIDPNEIYFFDHGSIERTYFIGFQDSEELRFREEVLGRLGELVIENGEIVERKVEDASDSVVAEAPVDPETTAVPEPAEETVETAVFADVE